MDARRSGKILRSFDMNIDTNSIFSAIFCTTGEQAAKRAKEGFDMVSCR